MNPLLCIPSPRDIGDFAKSLRKLDQYDQYIVKYHRSPEAYEQIQKFFLANKVYDRMVIIPDDLIVDKSELNILLMNSDSRPNSVISGICNFDAWNNREKYCFSIPGAYGIYPTKLGLGEYFSKYKVQFVDHLVKVEFNGFACPVIPRDIVKKIPFRHDANGSGVDINFCRDCLDNGIELLVEYRVKLKHLAGRKQGKLECWGVGLRKPVCVFRNPYVS